MLGQAAARRQLGQAPAGHVGVAHHHAVLGRAEQQRAGLGVGVTRPEDGVDLQRRPAGRGRVEAHAVVDDPLEDGQRPYPHRPVSTSHPPPPERSPDDPADAAALAGYAAALADAVDAAIPGWVTRAVSAVLAAQGLPAGGEVAAAAEAAGAAARADGAPRVRALLAADIDDQRGNPLAILRSLVRYPTDVLRAAGARPVPRDEFATRNFPEDVYDLAPAAFADVDPALHDPGLVWGAAKAHVHLARRRREGRR